MCRAEFCEAGELLMECVGEVLLRPVASMREAAAIERGINDVACYVFALDADHVVDTTSSGNIARFVNHSCRCSAAVHHCFLCDEVFARFIMRLCLCAI